MIAIVELERYEASTCILCNVVCKFHYRQEFSPIILLPIEVNLGIGLNGTVLPLGLAIYLSIENCR